MKPDPQQHRFLRRYAPGEPRSVLITASVAVVALTAALAATPIAHASDAADGQVVPQVDSSLRPAWQALRDADCARCHGNDYDGLAAPSIVEYARLVSRDLFIRKVLDGDPPRGMPGYRGVAPIATHIDEIYRYFVARASGSVGAHDAS